MADSCFLFLAAKKKSALAIGRIKLAGKIFVFDITQVALFTGLASVTIPALMIFLSVVLSDKVNGWTNIVVAVTSKANILYQNLS